MLLRPEAINAHLSDAVGYEKSCGDGRQKVADRPGRDGDDPDLAVVR